jgi:hypothetical protein
MNILIGLFFDEVGTELIRQFSFWDSHTEELRKSLLSGGDWSQVTISDLRGFLRKRNSKVDVNTSDLPDIREYLKSKRDFLLRLLENPNLLEHESFTALLRATFHLLQELDNRPDLSQIPETDRNHLGGDIERVYSLIILEWIDYMNYLKKSYPYLFSLAMRMNPFNREATPVVG